MNSKKIGIVTAYAYNYGSRLQAYAMQQIFASFGYDVDVLGYRYESLIKRLVKSVVSFIPFYHRNNRNRQFEKYFKLKYGHVSDVKIKKFARLRFDSLDEMSKLIKWSHFNKSEGAYKRWLHNYYAVVCGSDQIWKPIDNPSLLITSLNFVPDGVKRIAYAPSLGVNSIPDVKQRFFVDFLSKFDAISVREKSGKEILEKLTGKKVEQVLDPTLLVGRELWDSIIDESKSKELGDYCLCYFLGTSKKHRDLSVEVARQLGVKIVNFAHFFEYNDADEQMPSVKIADVTPQQFVGLVKNAKFVLTDSFHCSVFSCMYHVKFLTFMRFSSSDKGSTNTRLYSLLDPMGLSNRIFDGNDYDLISIINEKIDFTKSEEYLGQEREKSKLFISRALQND